MFVVFPAELNSRPLYVFFLATWP